MNKYYKLAQIIKLAGQVISADGCYDKYYSLNGLLGIDKSHGCIEVTDDSGYRNILIGNPYSYDGDAGYLLLYTDNNEGKGFSCRCYPTISEITRRISYAITEPIQFYSEKDDLCRAYNSNGRIDSSNVTRKASRNTIKYISDTIEYFADRLWEDERDAKTIIEEAEAA